MLIEWFNNLANLNLLKEQDLAGIEMGQGVAEIDLFAPDELYDDILKEIVGVEIRGKDHLLELMQDFAHAKAEYDHIADALKMVKQTGYGIASPSLSDMSLEEPEIIRQGATIWCKIKSSCTIDSYD